MGVGVGVVCPAGGIATTGTATPLTPAGRGAVLGVAGGAGGGSPVRPGAAGAISVSGEPALLTVGCGAGLL